MDRKGSRDAPIWISAIDDIREPSPRRFPVFALLWLLLTVWLGSHFSALALSLWVLGSLVLAGVSRRREAKAGPMRRPFRRGLLLETGSLSLLTGPGGCQKEFILAFERHFGLTLLCNERRERAALAITTKEDERTFYIAAAIPPGERRANHEFWAIACVVDDDEPALFAMAKDGKPLELGFRDLASLFDLLSRRDHRATMRCYLSDTQGEKVTLDGDELRIGEQSFDLAAPLEWRSLVFKEAGYAGDFAISDTDPHPAAIKVSAFYQATWVRQDSAEAVLVALIPSIDDSEAVESLLGEPRNGRELHGRLAPEPPPPRDLRRGIERTYMQALRAALNRAPQAHRGRGARASVDR